MEWKECLILAWESIVVNKVRSLLTMGGVTVGVAAVILTFAVGRGGQASFKQEIDRIGNYFVVTVKSLTAENIKEQERLREQDVNKLREEIPEIYLIAPVGAEISYARYQNKEKEITLLGTTPDYFLLRKEEIGSGRFFSWQEALAGRQVCVLSYETASRFFGKRSPLGYELIIMGRRFQVIGVTRRPKSGWSISIGAYQNLIYIPLASWQRLFGIGSLTQIYIATVDKEVKRQVMPKVRRLLNTVHHTKDRYETVDLKSIEDFGRLVGNIFTSIIVAIAAISLFVGGIGVMNIMLVSVTERTREIGIRMALGATPSHILRQFLVEAMLICMFGGLAGVVLGIGGAYFFATIFTWPPFVTGWVALLAVGFAVTVGLFFGLYPAYRAACMDPVEALRHE